jgi:hypothetical protein
MRPQLEPVLESHLAAILMGELLRPREDIDDTYVDIVLDDLDLDDEYYASFELVHEPAPAQDPTTFAAPTTKFVRVRDTSHDHIDTKKYPREALDADTLQTPKYSAPYELIDIEHPPIVVPTTAPLAPSYPNAQFPLNSAPYELVDIAHPIVAAPLAAEFTFYSNAKFPLNSAPYERVDLDDYSRAFVKAPTDGSVESAFMNAAPTDWSAAESTEVLSTPQTASRVIATIVVLIGALLLGLSIVVYGMSS